ncbi:hypothetical protein ACFX2C_035342 [Malus domestica]
MRIAELSTPELRRGHADSQPQHQPPSQSHQLLISQIESSIKQIENLSPEKLSPDTVSADLRRFSTKLSQLAPFPNSLKLLIWKLSYRLWNACVDLSNAASLRSLSASRAEDHAKLRHVAADLLFISGDVSGVPSPVIKSASFYLKTGLIWHDLRSFDLASSCFERATDIVSKIDIEKVSDCGERKLLLDLSIARSKTAWDVSDRNVAIALLNRAKSLLFGSPDHHKALANQFLAFGKTALAKSEIQDLNDALKLMNEALDLYEKGLRVARTREEIMELKDLRSKTLRFISAVHLQMNEFESVIKCVRVLREGCESGDHHPSLSVLAMKGWLGLGKYAEAEKELRGMVVNKGIPEGVFVSAVEAYFQAAGTAGAETAKGVFLGLLGRCHVSASSAVRVAHRVIGDAGEGSRIRAKVVAELVSDERVVALFNGDAAAQQRTAMHSVLWNCGAEHFRSKDYETSAEMFEKAMLYIPFDIESRILRAKGFRVLCLCHLGLSQLDQAHEYINEAEKLEPNIASAFLKFKIFLQKKDQNGATNQIQAMATCLDFTPNFLSLAAHEAVACHVLAVAVASLSSLLSFYTPGKSMPATEVVVLRTLVTILTQEPGNEDEALKFLKRVHNRASELGPDSFFGTGEVGRRERNWFAVTSWNLGTKTGKEKNYELCGEFLRLASEFYGLLVDGQVEENMVYKSLILSVSAIIASENQRKTTLNESEVKQAQELLDRAGKMQILKTTSAGNQLIGDQFSTTESDLFFIYTFCAYEIHGRLNDLSSQLKLVKNFATSKACNHKNLLQIGISASQPPRTNPEVAVFALNECLSSFLSSSTADYQSVALIVRKLIGVTSIHKGDADDDAVYGMYKQAYRVMVGLKDGEYPTEEGKWLAMTAWNRASLPVRLGQIDVARKWMDVGLQLAKHVHGMETYRACMEDFINGFEKRFSAPSFKSCSKELGFKSYYVNHSPHHPSLFPKPPPLPPFPLPSHPILPTRNFPPPKTFLIPQFSFPNPLISPTNYQKPNSHSSSPSSLQSLAFTLPSSASESAASAPEQVSDKINLESILVSIDDFFNRNPFFVAGCTFVWLVVIPLVRAYLRKYKFVLVIDAFRKLRDDPNAQLLDIRDEKNLGYLKSPNLKILNKCTVQVPFSEEYEAGFVKRVLEKLGNPAETVVCVLGSFDGISIKVAELLFKHGFKEAYAIKGGVGGTKGWLESQETLLPPSMHIYPKKKVKTSQETVTNGGVVRGKVESNGAATTTYLSAGESQTTDNGRTTKATDSVSIVKNGSRSSSPYPSYQDLKPPSSPTPSKP